MTPDRDPEEIPEAEDVGAPEGEYPREPRAAFAREVSAHDWRALAPVLGVMLLGLGLVFVNFRLGAALLAVAVLLAFVLRLTRSDDDAGILAVRRRSLDLTILGVLFVGLSALAIAVP